MRELGLWGILGQVDMERAGSYTGRLGRLWATIDERYLQPIFGGPATQHPSPGRRSYMGFASADNSEGVGLLR